uniref:Ribosomal protein S4 n=1 Tax=Gruberia lanceolata TaxID=1978530 RepID=A0A6C0UA65_9CILI|nr:ribosomal protein S4 [Gruberia lanceolata]
MNNKISIYNNSSGDLKNKYKNFMKYVFQEKLTVMRLLNFSKFIFININKNIFNIKFMFLFIHMIKLTKFLFKKFLLDLYYRFSNKGPIDIEFIGRKGFYFKKPVIANMHLIPWFLKTRTIYTVVGDWKYLPLNFTFSGIESPYIILYDKKPFWKFYESFTFLRDFWSLSFFKISDSFVLLKNNNLITNLDSKITQLTLRKLINKKKQYHNYFNLNNNIKYLNLNTYFKSIFSTKIETNNVFSRHFKNKSNFNSLGINRVSNKFIDLKHRQIMTIKSYRADLKYLFFIKKKEHYISKFCLKFKNKLYSNFNFLKYFELRLINVLLRVHFVHLLKDARFLIKNGFVLVNNKVVFNENYILKLGDKVNILFNKSFYVLYRECFSSSITRYYRMWPYIFTNFRNMNNASKEKTKIIPYWVTKSLWSEESVPKYLEVDYITMSFFIIYEPKTILDIFPYYYLNFKLNAVRLYNWRFYF